MIGRTLSHFKITAKLGEGGMGEVYRAEDTKLGREVAIKVLPEAVASDPERLARFEREAKVLASLNHPNIAGIHQVEEAAGVHFLVMELAEGEDLNQRLERGAVPVDEALSIALQIAEALEAAHEKGIIHRDLKPANVKLSANGQVKVLDFGLAKALDADRDSEGVAANLSLSPTLTAEMTGAGVILGTAAYMSPEQARGQAADKRADVWAFGVVLWEMLTGNKLFGGDTVTDIIAAVVTKDTDLDALPVDTPAPIRRVLALCLRKDPRTRLPDIGAARLELQEVLDGTATESDWVGASASTSGEGARKRTRERRMWAALLATVVAVAASLAVVHFSEEPEPMIATRFVVEAPDGWSFQPSWPVPSPDGSQVVFEARPRGPSNTAGEAENQQAQPMLWIRSLEAIDPRPLPGTEGAVIGTIFWSPDGRHLGFFADGELRRYNLLDGTVQRVCDDPGPFDMGADWNQAGQIIFATIPAGQIYVVPASGGEPKVIAELNSPPSGIGYHRPQFLPDGDRFLFSVISNVDDQSGLYLGSLARPQEVRRVVSDGTGWALGVGHLLVSRDNTLFAQPFDVERAALNGEPVAIAAQVIGWLPSPDIGWFGTSPKETIAYLHGSNVGAEVQLGWLDRSGNLIETVGEPGDYGQLTLAPDERKVALEIRDRGGRYDLWVMDVERGVSSRLTATPGDERDPVWSPDSRAVAFMARSGGLGLGHGDLRIKSLRAGESEITVTDSADADIPESWSADAAIMLVIRQTAENDQSVWAISLEGDGEAEMILSTGFLVDEPHLSPDERWLAYVSAESGRDEVYVEPFRRDGERVRVSVSGGGQPRWRGDGRELFYVNLDGRMMSVDIEATDELLRVSLPEDLFELQILQGTGYDDYAVSADGQRFLVKRPIGEHQGPELHVVTNWTSLLN